MIPKIIHFIWVGDKPKPDIVLKCLDSWKKFCPDFEIREWGNEALKSIDNLYVKQAYENKKWAFVSDYLRLYALDKFGGIYLDTDSEVTQSIEEFFGLEFFCGFEVYNGVCLPMAGILGAEAGNHVIKELLKQYEKESFVKDGTLNMLPITMRMADYFKERFRVDKPFNPDEELELCKNSVIYPSYYFCTPKENKVNYVIHHYCASWVEDYKRVVLFNFANYRIVRYRKNKKNVSDEILLLKGEKILFQFPFLRYKICLIKFDNKE